MRCPDCNSTNVHKARTMDGMYCARPIYICDDCDMGFELEPQQPAVDLFCGNCGYRNERCTCCIGCGSAHPRCGCNHFISTDPRLVCNCELCEAKRVYICECGASTYNASEICNNCTSAPIISNGQIMKIQHTSRNYSSSNKGRKTASPHKGHSNYASVYGMFYYCWYVFNAYAKQAQYGYDVQYPFGDTIKDTTLARYAFHFTNKER